MPPNYRDSHPFDRAVLVRIEAWRREVVQQMLVPYPNDTALDAILDRIYSNANPYELFEFLGSFALLRLPEHAIGLMVNRIADRFRAIEIARLEKPAPAPAAPAAAANLIERLQTHLRSAIGLLRGTNSVTYGAWATEVEHSDLLKPFPIA